MPVMTRLDASQSMGSVCGQLAIRTARMLDGRENELDEVVLQNVFRLLQMYRYDHFIEVAPRGVLELHDVPETVGIGGNVETVKTALDIARKHAFPGQDKTSALDVLDDVLYGLGRIPPDIPDRGAVEKTLMFFECLAAKLKRPQ